MDHFLFVWHGLFLSILCHYYLFVCLFEFHSCWYLLLLFYYSMLVVALRHVSVE